MNPSPSLEGPTEPNSLPETISKIGAKFLVKRLIKHKKKCINLKSHIVKQMHSSVRSMSEKLLISVIMY